MAREASSLVSLAALASLRLASPLGLLPDLPLDLLLPIAPGPFRPFLLLPLLFSLCAFLLLPLELPRSSPQCDAPLLVGLRPAPLPQGRSCRGAGQLREVWAVGRGGRECPERGPAGPSRGDAPGEIAAGIFEGVREGEDVCAGEGGGAETGGSKAPCGRRGGGGQVVAEWATWRKEGARPRRGGRRQDDALREGRSLLFCCRAGDGWRGGYRLFIDADLGP